MKKKITLVATSVLLVAAMVIGGTLAYFTDTTDVTDNVFTVGNVSIELNENFEQNSRLVPGKENAVKKEVWVENTGTEEAYVRVHIAIPAILDDGSDQFDASKNVLHFNYAKESAAENFWDWSKTTGAPYEGDWNYYEATIDGIPYNVYVVTYESILAPEAVTLQYAMNQVYLDSKVSNDDIDDIKKILEDNWKIKVVAEGVQQEGFSDAYAALNTAFGEPATDNNPFTGYAVEP